MDVRCENCGTEYELEESRLKPGGVTVKCTSCEHVFKVFRRTPGATSLGIGGQRQAPMRPDTVPEEMLFDPGSGPTDPLDIEDSGSARQPRRTPSSARHARRKERNWLIRLPSGEVETCRELATLQQWIVSGKVSRQSGISRTGNTWKRLGEIAELDSFFEIADDARRARRAALTPPPVPVPRADSAGPAPEGSGPTSTSSEVRRTLMGVPTAPVRARAASSSRPPSQHTPPAPPPSQSADAGSNPVATPPSSGGRHPLDSGPDIEIPDIPDIPEDPAPTPARAGSGAEALPTRPSSSAELPTSPEVPSLRALTPTPEPTMQRDPDAGPSAGPDLESGRESGLESDLEPGLESDLEPDIQIEVGTAPISDHDPDPDDGNDLGSDGPAHSWQWQRHGGEADRAPDADAASTEPSGPVRTDKPHGARPHTGADGHDGPSHLRRTGLAQVAAADEHQGPKGGRHRVLEGDDVAFGKGPLRRLGAGTGQVSPIADGHDDGAAPARDDDDHDDDHDDESEGSGAGRWIALVALVLMAASAAVVYMLVFRHTGEDLHGIGFSHDAGATAELGSLDAGADTASTDELLSEVDVHLHADLAPALEAMERQLSAVDRGAADAAVLVARARVGTALAGQLFDRAALVAADDDGRARELRRRAEARLLETLTLAQRALQADREDPGALAVMADVLRLQGRSRRQIESYLEQALTRAPDHREARLVRAQSLTPQRRTRTDARELLTALAATAGDDVRPLYRLALLDLDEGHTDEAARRFRQVLERQPTHAGAGANLARIEGGIEVDTSDPLPPEEDAPDHGDRGDRGGRGDDDGTRGRGSRRETSPASGDNTAPTEPTPSSPEPSYESLVGQAKAGGCGAAIPLYEQALDLNPSGTDALVGLGDCLLERGRAGDAAAKFRVALGVAPRHPDAMWGLAEAYRRQGNTAEALDQYRKYLDEHPNGRHAGRARARVEALAPAEPPDQSPTQPPASPPGDNDPSPPPADRDPAPAPTPEPSSAPTSDPPATGAASGADPDQP
ncbi:tetratricopeptide repeat protein [Haliangium sp.]|uniref:tetratricopeptide repeat protein n=1 Tax=Haliangium sp. TaxID=2663208 RepID=UPI003D0E0C03